MAISVTCDACGFEFQLKDHCAGKRGRCPECEAVVIVPHRGTGHFPGAEFDQDERDSTPPSRQRRARRAPLRSSSFPAWATFGAVAAAVMAIGGIMFLLGRAGRERNDGAAAGVKPPAVDQTANATDVAAAPGAKPAEVPVQPAASVPATVPAIQTSTTQPPPAQTASVVPSSPAPAQAVAPSPAESTAESWRAKDLAELIEVVEPSVVRINVQGYLGKGNGSGFVVDRNGIVITNHHVIERARSATAIFPDGSTAQVSGVFKADASRDIAVLKIDYPADKLRPIKLSATLPRKGEQVAGFGAPLGLNFSASQGIVSAVRSEKEVKELGMRVSGTWVQTTTPISPGNSGGPLVNMRGEVVAANTMTLVQGQNLNFAVSSLDIRALLQDLPKTPTPLSQWTTAPPGSHAPGTLDESSTERGRQLLAKTKELSLLVSSFSFDPTGRVKQVVQFHAERYVKQAGVAIAAKPAVGTPQMVVTMGLTTGTGGGRLMVDAVLTCKDQDEEGRPVSIQAWKLHELLGTTVSETDLQRGVFPTAAETELAALFDRFRVQHAEAARKGPPTTGSK